jgi:hypothetical protein
MDGSDIVVYRLLRCARNDTWGMGLLRRAKNVSRLRASVLSERGNLPRMAQTGVQASFFDRWGCILSEQHLDPNAQDQDGQE